MTETRHFAVLVLVVAAAGLVAVLSNRFSERIKVPLPAVFLAAAAVAKLLIDDLPAPPPHTVEGIVTIALLLILFDGGQKIGWPHFRSAAAPILVVGVVGTFLTVAAAAVFVHVAFGLAWYAAVLVATAISPTDPAVVFSVLGQREIDGRSGTVLEGESGVNDPVGIALMASLIAAGGLGVHAFVSVGGSFLSQMLIGAAVGVVGGRVLLWSMRRMALPSEGLYPLRTLASVMVLYGLATLAEGSGFLAVFVAGILLGDARAPYKLEIQRFHGALASLGEIVAFVVLGLTVDLAVLVHGDVWLPGVLLGLALAVVIRPLLVGLCVLPARLDRNETGFVLFAGLKGAVPILLGSFIVEAEIPEAQRLYGIVVVAVVFSVVVQGTLVPFVAEWLRLPIRAVEVEPWALGVRLRDEPDGVHRLTIAPGAPADGSLLEDIPDLPSQVWVSFVVRDRELVRVAGDTRLRAGDEVLVIGAPDLHDQLAAVFAGT